LSELESKIIEKCIEGSARAQKQLYDMYSPMCWGIALRYAKNSDDAKDILQNCFVTVYTKLEAFNGKGALGAWIRKIAVNSALMHYRSNKKHSMYATLDEVGFLLESEQQILSQLKAEDLLKLLKSLPHGYQMVFNLYGVEGYSHKEVAELLGITESTSRSQYTRARKLMIEKINEEEKLLNEQIS